MHTSTTVQTTTAAGEPWNTKRAGNRHCFAFYTHTQKNSTFPHLPFCLEYLKCSGQAFTKFIHYSVNWDSCYQRNICFILFNSLVSCMNICMTLIIYFVVLVSFCCCFVFYLKKKKTVRRFTCAWKWFINCSWRLCAIYLCQQHQCGDELLRNRVQGERGHQWWPLGTLWTTNGRNSQVGHVFTQSERKCSVICVNDLPAFGF